MRYILSYTGQGKPRKKILSILNKENVSVLDGSELPEMAIVDLTPTQLQTIGPIQEDGWGIFQLKENSVRRPTTVKKLHR